MTVYHAVGYGVFSLVLPFMLSLLYIYYADQQIHDIYIYICMYFIYHKYSCMFQCICIITLESTRLRLPEDDADALKRVAVCMIYKIL